MWAGKAVYNGRERVGARRNGENPRPTLVPPNRERRVGRTKAKTVTEIPKPPEALPYPSTAASFRLGRAWEACKRAAPPGVGCVHLLSSPSGLQPTPGVGPTIQPKSGRCWWAPSRLSRGAKLARRVE